MIFHVRALFVLWLAGSTLALNAQHVPEGRHASPHTIRQVSAIPPIFLKAVRASEKVRYAGERIVEFQSGAVRKSHHEYVLQDGPSSRVWFPPGSPMKGQVVVETRSERLHYFPGGNRIEVLPPRREEVFERIRRWIQHPGPNIHLTAGAGENVAGRRTYLGTVINNKGAVMQRLWIDCDTGLVLKREVLDAVGARVGYFEFVSVDYHPVVHATDFQINVPTASRFTLDDKIRMISRRSGMLDIRISTTMGFSLENVNILRPSGSVVMHQAYLGPKGRLSLFQVATVVDMSEFQRDNRRGVQFYSWEMNGHSFALVGNYTADELRELARSIGTARNGP